MNLLKQRDKLKTSEWHNEVRMASNFKSNWLSHKVPFVKGVEKFRADAVLKVMNEWCGESKLEESIAYNWKGFANENLKLL